MSGIYLYSYRQYGESKADEYLLALEKCFIMLTEQPHLGREIDHIRKGLRSLDYENHAIFYKTTDEGVMIMRVIYSMRNTPSLLAEK
ncbi:MAG: type II toxin-antitoxin system RelE/ParE family toxin [Magnetococcales bacterium]|nr:type II toxin-antitoxin system RelE/ParE family toxin [Magnetococcales bacterium]